MSIKVDATFKVQIGRRSFKLTKEEAEKLYVELKKHFDNSTTVTIPWTPSMPVTNPWDITGPEPNPNPVITWGTGTQTIVDGGYRGGSFSPTSSKLEDDIKRNNG